MDRYRFVMVAAKRKKLLIAALAVLLLTVCWGAQESLCGLRGVLGRAESCDSIVLINDDAAGFLLAPDDRMATYLKVVSWLRSATPYEESIPPFPEDANFAANINPVTLELSGSHTALQIMPEYYLVSEGGGSFSRKFIENVLSVNDNEKITYVRCPKLYQWLKSDSWRKECRLWNNFDL